MKVLLLGSNGMLGQSIAKKYIDAGVNIVTADKTGAEYCFDFTNDNTLKACVYETCPDIIINAAAIVDLGFCENNAGIAYQVNTRIPGILVDACREQDIYLVQISTDHYYIEGGSQKHNELEKVTLVNEYARTKYLGEILALNYERALVLRTNIVGFRGSGKATFIEWVIGEIEKGTKLNLFTDFYTSSIHTIDFANILIDLIKKQPVGIYNLASSDVSSKKEFIIALSKALFNTELDYNNVSVNTIINPKRAASLGLDNTKVENLLGYKMPGLERTIESLRIEFYERKRKYEI